MILAAAIAALLLQQSPAPGPGAPPPAAPAKLPPALATQVMLDRAGFSPGALDGRMGPNTKRALALFEKNKGNPSEAVEPVRQYTITDADAQGPFQPIPEDMVQKSKLPALGYASVLEALAERFHATPKLLQQLNPGATFEPGTTVLVPNVEPLILPAEQIVFARPQPKDKRAPAAAGTSGQNPMATITARPDLVITVKASTSDLTVQDASGRVLMYAPVTTGSEHDPLPIGEWKVNGLQFNPKFHYNPDLFWDADPAHSKAIVPPGPNNPVGIVWIDITKEHYGIHGTPEPETIGRTQSHGCVRLTNWDALKLAGVVKPGTRVVFER
jgi:lipoprotein-anchoring transpeptidase ErfK/SrfK